HRLVLPARHRTGDRGRPAPAPVWRCLRPRRPLARALSADGGRMKARFRHSMPYGAEVLDAGGVRFRLWAPAANRVAVAVESETGERTYPMHALDDGWFECVAEAAGAGSRYRYQLEDGSLMPDP